MTSRQSNEFGNDIPIDEPLPGNSPRTVANDDSKPFPFAKGRSSSDRTSFAPSGQTEPRPTNRSSSRNIDSRNIENADPYASSGGQGSGGRSGGKTNVKISGTEDSVSGSASTSFDGKKRREYSDTEMKKRLRKFAMLKPGIGLEKTITVRVWSNRVVIGEKYEIVVDRQLATEQLTDRVLLAIDQVQAEWPQANKGYHWVPTLRYEVVPGGEQLHQRLNSALFDLGMPAKVEFLPNDPEQPSPSSGRRETSRSRVWPPAATAASTSAPTHQRIGGVR